MAYQLSEHHFEQTLGDSEGQGSLVCCSPWCHRELHMTERLNNICQMLSVFLGLPWNLWVKIDLVFASVCFIFPSILVLNIVFLICFDYALLNINLRFHCFKNN